MIWLNSNLGIVYKSDTAFTTCKGSWTTGASIVLPKGTYVVLRRGYTNDSQKFLFGHGYNAGEYTSSKNTDTNEYVLDVTVEALTDKTTVRTYIYGENSKVVTNGIAAIKIN